MDTFKLLTITSSLLILCSVISCSDDDFEVYEKEDLIGSYKRNDATNNKGYELVFFEREGDLIGFLSAYSGGCDKNGEICLTAAWSIDRFNWSIIHNVLKLEYEDETIVVKFALSENGNLHLYEPTRLTDYQDLYFIRIN